MDKQKFDEMMKNVIGEELIAEAAIIADIDDTFTNNWHMLQNEVGRAGYVMVEVKHPERGVTLRRLQGDTNTTKAGLPRVEFCRLLLPVILMSDRRKEMLDTLYTFCCILELEHRIANQLNNLVK